MFFPQSLHGIKLLLLLLIRYNCTTEVIRHSVRLSLSVGIFGIFARMKKKNFSSLLRGVFSAFHRRLSINLAIIPTPRHTTELYPLVVVHKSKFLLCIWFLFLSVWFFFLLYFWKNFTLNLRVDVPMEYRFLEIHQLNIHEPVLFL